ncbi:MAG: 50S ribosomal protein L23 [Candidatus Binatus sp.]|uniref:50S ribosomal protein L23 n=1 Tax=Candidatus Binatus sp. TaxID=2811406 RepID=UPI002722BE77|nr:50S ribosomal protein L23 [Candidatus Binatus sp.]MDO8434437.1 50S ribosomal protein L23 [Candidatus Binatus sp.]
MSPENLILAPIITEKGTFANEKAGQVLFRVREHASKDQIRVAIEQLFKVSVVKVRTMNFLGKERRKGLKKGRQMNWKKAYVTLKEGDKIEFFEGL